MMLKALEQFRHRRFRRDLSAYVDDMLSEKARRRLEAHLHSCEACRQELAELRATVETLGSLPMAEVPRSFTLAAPPVAEVRPRPTARRLEFGLRLATATAAFALTLVVVGDFAGLPGGGEQEEEKPSGMLLSANQETPAVAEAVPVGTPAAEETQPMIGAVPAETPAAVEAPPAETPAAVEAPPVEAPAAEETPSAIVGAPAETPEPPGIWSRDVPGVTEGPTPAPAGVEEGVFGFGEQAQDKATVEDAEVDEEADLAPDGAPAVAEEEDGGLSRGDVVRWLEIGLGAGVGILVVLWVTTRFHRGIGDRG